MPGLGMAWSPDGKSLYYADMSAGALKKVEASGGTPVTVRSEPTRNVIGLSGGTLYYMVERPLVDGRPEFDIRAATPEDGPSRLLARIPASRVAAGRSSILPFRQTDNGSRCRSPMASRPTSGRSPPRSGEWRQVTDFGDRAIFIARKVSWSPDGKSILAAIGEGDADIVLLDGLIARR